ncbi:TPA: hypothetical protein DIV55_06025 [Patescibacteria group bacterium]|uniref:UbiA prenyltransferase n=1 Tax=Candidatus Curtissbacteria bacterium GW2011_GWA1_40_16 TaxID=1618405 RepID=A0A0G0UKD3_9BACT|nr:MAG: hypothetical protein UT84_C0008G0021 [Candidatus Curtissbacteria bacterium GW2011_GWA1_40_16]HCS79264.1 hypothetical protein [Patescibacteria group bacterium]
MKPLDLLYFYRLLNWKHKISSIRPLGFAVFGYIWAGKFEAIPLIANTIAVFGAILFWFSINDYSDLNSPKEESFMKTLIKTGKLTRERALTLCLLPLILTPIVIFTSSKPAILIFTVILFLNFFYSAGPLRLKSHKYLWVAEAVLAAPLLFLESYIIRGSISTLPILMAVILALFYFYTGIIHILEDFQTGEKVQKIPQPLALKLLKVMPLISLIVSLVFSPFFPIFLITAFFSIIRIISLKNFKPDQVQKTRRNLFSPQLSLYEFAAYALIAITGQG